MPAFKLKYKEEAKELIGSIERSLLAMESSPGDRGLIEQVFRDMHTLKGNSSMFGFKTIADFTHDLESVYDLVRSGKITMSKEIMNITFSAIDHLLLMINHEHASGEKEKKTHNELSGQIAQIINKENFENAIPFEHDTNAGANEKKPPGYQIRFVPHRNFFLNGSNPISLLSELHDLGQCAVTANTADVPLLEDCEADKCYTSWDIHLSTNADVGAIRDVFHYAGDRCELDIMPAAKNGLPYGIPAKAANPDVSPHSRNVEETGSPAQQLKSVTSGIKKNVISSIRVPSERLDNLMNLVSELMTLQAKLGILAEQDPYSELIAITENLEKISTRLRDNAFSMCLIPVQNMVTPFHRLVRDLATELNKEIEFNTEGTETELDKNIIEGLSDPIMHLLRNSIDHGIEDPETRIRAGKPRQGKILFRAFCAGTNVFIEIQDDGKGINAEKIRNKAIQRGIITGDDELNDGEILSLIFLPGFSTAEYVSEISGRGVGLDVVKRKISEIRGQIKIYSQVNAGTTVTIRLPITVSIIDGLLVKINDADFVIPISSVERCYELPLSRHLNRFNNLIVLDGEQIPFISLSQEFDRIEDPSASQEIVIVSYEEIKVALIVDRVVGKFQAVLKPLGRYFLRMNTISGATILGDGKIALVLDTNHVIEQFLNKKVFQHVENATNRVVSDVQAG